MPDSFSEMRRRNAHRVLDLVREHGELSRADLARLADLSKATVSSITAELIDLDLLHETGAITTDKGRRPVGLIFNAKGKLAVGISIDDQRRATINVCDLDGKMIGSSSLKDAADARPEELVEKIKSVFATSGLDLKRCCAIGLAIPGPISEASAQRFIETARALEKLLHIKVSVQTLVDMAALAESVFGQAASQSLVLFVRTSHRLRSTVLYNNQLLSQHDEVGGEAGHVTAPWIEDECSCGRKGCANAHLGSPHLLKRAERKGLRVSNVDELIEKCNSGDSVARSIIADAGRATGFALAPLINVHAPVTVIVGGRLIECGDYFFKPVREACMEFCADSNFQCSTIQRSSLGGDSAAIGAAIFALSKCADLVAPIEDNGNFT